MSGLIPQRFIDDLLARIDILDVVDPRVKLRKTGKNYAGLCPFHQEKSPSFTVNPDKQFYYCFGCGAGGNAIGFVMNFDNLDFVGAVEALAKDAGLEVPREDSPQARQQNSKFDAMHALLKEAAEYYQQQLRQHPQKQRAVGYLKGRGLSGAIARDFGLGYAPPGWDNLLKQLGSDAARQRLMFDAGLLIERDAEKAAANEKRSPYYDRFRDRIMYPIRDTRGRVIGFGGRVLGDDKPKYLNSPETAVFHKGEELYGLYEARQKLKKPERFVIVEGYMDVIALHQSGIHYCVATLGTATSSAHLRTLFKQVPEVVFCFDGDNAGREAAWRALQQALPLLEDGRSARFLFLPEGEDPDTQVRRIGNTAFEAALASATRLPDFFFDTLLAKVDRNSLEGRAQLGRLALPLIDKLPKGIFRQLMLDELSKLTGVPVDTLTPNAAHAPSPRPPGMGDGPPPGINDGPPPGFGDGPPPGFGAGREQSAPRGWTPRPKPGAGKIRVENSPCLRAVTLLIRKPDIIANVPVPDEFGEIRSPDMDLLLKVIEIARAWPGSTPPELMSRIYATAYGAQMTQLLSREQITPETGIEDEFRDIVHNLLDQYRRDRDRASLVAAARARVAARQSGSNAAQTPDP
ncbi:MAG: DNA primase [Gammaproteobacteria bacterium]